MHAKGIVVGKIAERRQMTVMFVDMVGSTQRLHNCDPEEFFEFIIDYQSHIKKCAARFEGNVARFIGDGALVYFGWPTTQEDGAVRAIRTGQEIITGISSLLDPHGDPTACRIGIATGVVVVGETTTQSRQRQDEIFGEVPHLAERLHAIAQSNSIIVCLETQTLANREFDFQQVPDQKLKGIEHKQSAFVVVKEKPDARRFTVNGPGRRLETFGRDGELSYLDGLWRRATKDEGQIVWISGDAGIGKSHLVEAVRGNLGEGNTTTVRYQCSRFNSQSPYYPFVKRTEIWAGMESADPPEVRLKKFVERLGEQPDGEMLRNISAMMGFPRIETEFPNRSEQEEKDAVCSSLLQLLKIAIKQYSALILIEDVHLADPSSLNLVNYFNTHAKQMRALILVTYRDEIDAPGSVSDNHHQIDLGPLDAADSRKIVIDVAADQVPDEKLIEAIVAKTDGIPLYVDACTRAFLDAKKSSSTDRSFQGKMDVPFSLHDILMERLDRLGEPKVIAQICSAIGHEFTAALVENISERTSEEVDDALEKLTNAEILIRVRNADEPVYRFRHSLIQDVAYQGLLKRRRRQLHLTIARVLEARHPDLVDSEPEFIAEHFRAAERYPDALNYLLAAAKKSLAKFANREAIDHADQGIVLIRKLDDQTQKYKLELEFQMIKALAGRALYGFAKKSTIRAFQRMMELATKAGSARHYCRAIRGLFKALHAEGRYNDALTMADRMIESSGDDLHGHKTAHHMRAIPLIWQGKFLCAKRELELAIGYFYKINGVTGGDDDKKPVQIQSSLSITLAFLGRYNGAYKLGHEALQQARIDGNSLEIANSYLSACNTMRIIRHPCALDIAQEFQAFVGDREIPYYSAAVSAFVGLALFEEGEKKTGLDLLKNGWQQFIKTQSRLNQVFYMAELADCNLQTGNLSEAVKAIDSGFELMTQYGERNFEAELHRIKGDIMVAEGEFEQKSIIKEYQQAINIAQQQSARIFELRASVSLAKLYNGNGDAKNADCALHEICASFGGKHDSRDLREACKSCNEPACPRDKMSQSPGNARQA